LGGNVLDECPTQRDVQYLRASADRQCGDPPFPRCPCESKLVGVARAVWSASGVMRRLPEMRRVDVFTAGEHESRDIHERRGRHRWIDGWKYHRHESDRSERRGVCLVHAHARQIADDLGRRGDDDEWGERHRAGAVAWLLTRSVSYTRTYSRAKS